MSDAESADDWLFFKVGEAFFNVRIDGERKAGFSNFGDFAGFERGGGDFGGFGKFVGILCEMIARRDIAAAHVEEAPGGDEISEAIDAENAGDSGAIIDEADEGAGEEHAGLHTDEDSGVCAGVLAGGNYFLHE